MTVEDEQFLEERLIQKTTPPSVGRFVRRPNVGDETERVLEIEVDDGFVLISRVQSGCNLVELARDSSLLASQEIERDGIGVVRLENALALAQQPPLLLFECSSLGRDLSTKRFEVDAEPHSNRIALTGHELDRAVAVDHQLLNRLDGDVLGFALGAFLMAAEADEVGIQRPVTVAILRDDHPTQRTGLITVQTARLEGDPILYSTLEEALEVFVNFHMEGVFNTDSRLPDVLAALQQGLEQFREGDRIAVRPGCFTYEVTRL